MFLEIVVFGHLSGLKIKKCFYLAYTANEQVALAMADSWMGPFQQMKANPVDISEKKY